MSYSLNSYGTIEGSIIGFLKGDAGTTAHIKHAMHEKCQVVKPDYTAPAVPPDSDLEDSTTPTLGDLWRVGGMMALLEIV